MPDKDIQKLEAELDKLESKRTLGDLAKELRLLGARVEYNASRGDKFLSASLLSGAAIAVSPDFTSAEGVQAAQVMADLRKKIAEKAKGISTYKRIQRERDRE